MSTNFKKFALGIIVGKDQCLKPVFFFLLFVLISGTLSAQTISSINPTCKTAGEGNFTLIVQGTGFNSGPTIKLNGVTLSSNQYTIIGSTEIHIQVQASYIASAGSMVLNISKGSTSVDRTLTILPIPIGVSAARCGPGSVKLTASGAPSGTSYRWYTQSSGGTAVSSNSTYDTPNINLSTTYYLAIITSAGCESTRVPVIATVRPLPVATIEPSGSTTFCQGGSVTLTAKGGTSWLWSTGATTESITVSTSGNYSVRVTDNNSCTSASSTPVTVTVNPQPSVTSVTAVSASKCVGANNKTVFDLTGVVANGNPSWSFVSSTGSITQAGTNISTPNTNNTQVTVDGTGTVTLRLTASSAVASCNNATRDITLTVHPLPVATIEPSGPTTFCQGGSVTLTAKGGTSWLWSTGATTESITVSTAGSYSVKVSDGNTCQSLSSVPVTVTVNSQPSVTSLTAPVTEKCVGPNNATVFDLSGVVANGSPSWSFAVVEGTASVTFSDPTSASTQAIITGTGKVRAILTSNSSVASCAPATREIILTVNPQPTASATAVVDKLCVGAGNATVFNLQGTVTGGAPLWEYVSSTGSITQGGVSFNTPNSVNTAVTVQGIGTVTIRLRASSQVASCTMAESTIVLTVNPLPIATITPTGPTNFCSGSSVTLTADDGVSWVWSNGATTRSIEVSASGTFTVAVTNSSGCTVTSEPIVVKVVTLDPKVATITYTGSSTVCDGNTVMLQAAKPPSGQVYKYVWEFRAQGSSTWTATGAIGQTYPAEESGDYRVIVSNVAQVSGDVECDKISEAVTVTVNPLPVASITPESVTTFCQGGSVLLSANTGSFSYQWYKDGVKITAANGGTARQYSAIASGNYAVQITNTTTGCISTIADAVAVTVVPQPKATITTTGAALSKCVGVNNTVFNLAGTTANGTPAWSVVNSTGTAAVSNLSSPELENTQVTVTGIGTVTVRLTASSNVASCNDSFAEVTLTVKPLPTADAGPDQELCVGNGKVTIFNRQGSGSGNDNNLEAKWEIVSTVGVNRDSVNVAYPWLYNNFVSIPGIGKVVLRLTVTVNGCSVSDEVVYTVKPRPTVTVVENKTYCNGATGGPITFGSSLSGSTYKWTSNRNIGFGISGDGTIPEFTALNTGTAPVVATISVRATGDECEGPAQTFTITVNPSPKLNTSLAPSAICSGTAFNYAPGSATDGAAYTWTRAAVDGISNPAVTTPVSGGISETLINTTNAPVTVTYKYTTTANGCTGDPQEVKVVVNPTPALSSTLTPAAICSGTAFTYTPASTTGTGSFSWERLDATNITSSGSATGSGAINQVLTNSGTAPVNVTYRYTITALGCKGIAQDVVVTVNPNPKVTLELAKTAICAGEITTIKATATSGSGSYSYTWTVPSGATAPSGNTSSFTVNTAGVYTVTVTDAKSCVSATASINLIVNPLPTVSFTGLTEGQTIYSGADPIDLVGSPAGGIFSGPGIEGNKFNPCTAGAAGTKTITYTYKDGNGCTNTSTKTINLVTSTYSVVVTANPFPICRGQNTVYTAHVYRDAKVIYPYVANALGQPIGADGKVITDAALPTVNMDYFTAAGIDPNTLPSIILLNAWRFFEPIVQGGVLVNKDEIDAANKSNSFKPTKFEYKWTKNDSKPNNGLSGNFPLYGQAGLSSTDWYAVEVKSLSGTSCPVMPIQLSHRMYLSEPNGYNITIAPVATLCNTVGTENEDITLTATLGDLSGGWAAADLKYQWIIDRNKTLIPLSQLLTYTSGTTVSITVPKSSLQNGDKVFIDFQTSYDTYPGINSKCLVQSFSPSIDIKIEQPAFATEETTDTKTVCEGESVSFSVSGTGTGLTIQWFKVGSSQPITTGNGINIIPQTINGGLKSTLEIPDVDESHAGTYYAILSNTGTTACTTPYRTAGQQLTVNPVAEIQAMLDATYCPLNEAEGAMLELQDSELGINYSIYKGNTLLATKPGTGDAIQFGPYLDGDYTIKGVDVNSGVCKNDNVATASIKSTQINIGEVGSLAYENLGNGTWKITALESGLTDESIKFGASPEFTWYQKGTLEPESEWVEIKESDDAVIENNYIILKNTPPNTDIKVEVLSIDICQLVTLLADQAVIPFPVELIEFKAIKKGDDVVLNWATAMEKDNTGFEIQVSDDGQVYRKLDFVPTKNGNSSIKLTYSYTDTERNKRQTRYYRLKQIDVDGTYELFGPVSVNFGEFGEKMVAYPNPFTEDIYLDVETDVAGPMEVTMTDVAGKKILTRTIDVQQGKDTYTIKLEKSTPSGAYFITTRRGDEIKHFKLIKQ